MSARITITTRRVGLLPPNTAAQMAGQWRALEDRLDVVIAGMRHHAPDDALELLFELCAQVRVVAGELERRADGLTPVQVTVVGASEAVAA